MENTNNDLKYIYTCTLVFFILALFNILHHEMWRDELQAWSIALSANSFPELFVNIRYEGHPSLWFIILYLVKHLTANPAAMQMVHLFIATLSAFIFLRFAPFNKLLRGLFIFGYFPFFEYATISRNYAVGILFLFIFCACYGEDLKNRNYLFLSAILFLMCQCNPLSAVLAIALAITVFLEPLLLKNFTVYKPVNFYVSILIFAAGLIISITQMIPPADTNSFNPFVFDAVIPQRIANQISRFWNVFVPIPRIQMDFWHTNFLSYLPVQKEIRYVLRLIFSLGLFMVPLFILFRKTMPAFYYATAVAGLFVFGYIFHEGMLRHNAHYYFVFVSALWLHNYYPAENRSLSPFFSFFERNKNTYITVIFLVGVIAGAIANTLDCIYPFSGSKETAYYIKQNNLQSMPVAGHHDFAVNAVAAYLGKPFYSAVTDKTGSFTVWNTRKFKQDDVLRNIEKYCSTVRSDILVVLNTPAKYYDIQQYRLIPLKEFTNNIVTDENFYLYIMRYE